MFKESITLDEASFESGVFLQLKEKVKILQQGIKTEPRSETTPEPEPNEKPEPETITEPLPTPEKSTKTLRITGTIPPEIWNRFGTKILPKLRSGENMNIGINLSVTIHSEYVLGIESDLKQILEDLDISEKVLIAKEITK